VLSVAVIVTVLLEPVKVGLETVPAGVYVALAVFL
jgi:hypothetical protein